jgi:hypothetical protein
MLQPVDENSGQAKFEVHVMKMLKISGLCLLLAASVHAFAEKPVISIVPSQGGIEAPVRGMMNDADRVVERTGGGGAVDIAFVAGGTPVVGLQFDLAASGGGAEELEALCNGKRLASGHSLTCNALDESTVRVIVFSVSNKPISTGAILSLPRGVDSLSFVEGSVQLGDANAKAVEGEVL